MAKHRFRVSIFIFFFILLYRNIYKYIYCEKNKNILMRPIV